MSTALLSEAQIKSIVKDAVLETFLSMGLNVAEPDDRLEYQKDQHFVRAERMRKERTASTIWNHLLTMVVSGIVAAALLGVVELFARNSN